MARGKRPPDNPARIASPQPAPGDLETVQAFANTTGPAVDADELASPAGLARWLIGRRLLADGTELGEDERRRAVDVRWGLRSLAAANNGAKLDPEAVHRLEQATAPSRFRLTHDEAGPAGFEQVAPSFDDALGHLLAVVATARFEGRWQLFKICARNGCRRVFFDFSQSHNAKFCTRRCADRARARTYRNTDWYKQRYRG